MAKISKFVSSSRCLRDQIFPTVLVKIMIWSIDELIKRPRITSSQDSLKREYVQLRFVYLTVKRDWNFSWYRKLTNLGIGESSLAIISVFLKQIGKDIDPGSADEIPFDLMHQILIGRLNFQRNTKNSWFCFQKITKESFVLTILWLEFENSGWTIRIMVKKKKKIKMS